MSKLLFSFFLLTLLYVSCINAGYEVTFPGTGTVLNAGDRTNVTWLLNDLNPNETTVLVRLYSGDPANLTEEITLCQGIDPTIQKCDWTVPKTIVSKIDYTVLVGTAPESIAFGSFFSIVGKGPLPPNNGCPNMGGHTCSGNLPCCSATGYCGSGDTFCGSGCQAKFSLAGACGSSGGAAAAPATPAPSTSPSASSPYRKFRRNLYKF